MSEVYQVWVYAGGGRLLLYRVYEVDAGVWCAFCRNKRGYYGDTETEEMYLTFRGGRWITEPETSQEIIGELAAAIREYWPPG